MCNENYMRPSSIIKQNQLKNSMLHAVVVFNMLGAYPQGRLCPFSECLITGFVYCPRASSKSQHTPSIDLSSRARSFAVLLTKSFNYSDDPQRGTPESLQLQWTKTRASAWNIKESKRLNMWCMTETRKIEHLTASRVKARCLVTVPPMISTNELPTSLMSPAQDDDYYNSQKFISDGISMMSRSAYLPANLQGQVHPS
jgi:hypothetical protein